jgi:predicted nucleotidyltransferase component of viral defense system
MLTLKQIEGNYPENLRAFKKNLLREYLQYKILEIIFGSEFSSKLSFIGGTALRIIYDNKRFSEDLDFDNFGLTEKKFSKLADAIKAGLKKQGFEAEISNVFKGAYRCRIRIPEILFVNELSVFKEEKIMIQVDTEPHNFAYQPERKILNKFDVFTEIFSTPPGILLSQKIFAALNRKRAKGRDFYDIVFLLSFTKPNYNYLKEKIGVGDADDLRARFLKMAAGLDFKELAQDVRQFLFNPVESRRVKLFIEFIKQARLK